MHALHGTRDSAAVKTLKTLTGMDKGYKGLHHVAAVRMSVYVTASPSSCATCASEVVSQMMTVASFNPTASCVLLGLKVKLATSLIRLHVPKAYHPILAAGHTH